jgi:outer membrane protein assembly factor BamB
MPSIRLTTLFLLLSLQSLSSQNWPVFGGGGLRNGRTKIAAPESLTTPKWTVNAPVSTLGNAVYTFGDRFVTSRITFSPYRGNIECRSLQSGALIWTSPFLGSTSILYATGFTQDAVYAHDYSNDSIYALRPDNGQIKWRSSIKSHTFGAYPGFVFACNGDPILNGPIAQGIFTMRLDKNTGEPLWTNSTIIAIGPSAILGARGDRVYRITGGITLPIVLTAIDADTGEDLYDSAPIPGDGDQENPLTLGDRSEIYFWRDGGNLYAYNDLGFGFEQKWAYTPAVTSGAALTGNISLGHDGHLYVFDESRVKKINSQNGTVLHSSIQMNISQPSITVDGDSTVLVNTGLGQFYAFSPDLQTIKWQLAAGNNVYCNPAPAKDGILVITQGGGQIRAFQSDQNRAPVADFRVAATRVGVGQPLAFQDQSSYLPDGWAWFFEGGTPTFSSLANPVVTYDAPGVYDVLLIAQNILGADTIVKPCHIEVTPVLGTQTDEAAAQARVFPNPTAGALHVQLPEDVGEVYCRVVDARGVLAFQEQLSDGQSSLDFSRLPSGVYYLQLRAERRQWTAKVVRE